VRNEEDDEAVETEAATVAETACSLASQERTATSPVRVEKNRMEVKRITTLRLMHHPEHN
jgi:hypothetical protein